MYWTPEHVRIRFGGCLDVTFEKLEVVILRVRAQALLRQVIRDNTLSPERIVAALAHVVILTH